MADVHIHSMESRIDIVDSEALLTPELVERLTAIIRQRLQQDGQRQKEADKDRKLIEGAAR